MYVATSGQNRKGSLTSPLLPMLMVLQKQTIKLTVVVGKNKIQKEVQFLTVCLILNSMHTLLIALFFRIYPSMYLLFGDLF